MTTDTVVISSHSTARSSSSSSGSKSSSSSWLIHFILLILLPFIAGGSISMGIFPFPSLWNHRKEDTYHPIIQRLLSVLRMNDFINNNTNTTSSTKFVPKMDVDRCFQQLERHMWEKASPQWEILDHIPTIFIHRNGQAHSCGNFTTTTSSSSSTNVSRDNGTQNTKTADPTSSSSSSSSSPSSSVVHRIFRTALQEMYHVGQACPDYNNKYHVESFMTRVFMHMMTSSVCSSEDDDDDIQQSRNTHHLGLFDYCDMGEDKTPILLDHTKLIPNTMIVKSSSSSSSSSHQTHTLLPCHFHTEHGLRVTSLSQFKHLLLLQIKQNQNRTATTSANESTNVTLEPPPTDCVITPEGDETCSSSSNVPTTNTIPTTSEQPNGGLHLYAVPAGRVFMHVAAYIGQEIELNHVPGADPNQRVYLKVLSVSPAVFDLYNFFTKDESAELVQRALSETKESHRIKRSTTGTGEHHVNTRRTSESGFDTDGATSIRIKQRCFQVLGFDEYIESHGDGLQILRYNQTTAYIPHMDYLDLDKRLEHDYDSSKKGGNRFATILLYMTDLGEKDGGETVFIDAWPTGQREEDHVPIETALRELRESDQHGILEEGSWQEKMVAQCRSRLAIRPDSARAVLFYSQYPNGRPDPHSKHGGCPVLSGVKYAANLWVWNTPRDGYPGNPKNPEYKSDKKTQEKNKATKEDGIPPGRVTATFRNSGKDTKLLNAKLYFYDGSTDKEWGSLGFDESLSIHTYKTHVWKVMVDGELIQSFTIESDQPAEQEFVV